MDKVNEHLLRFDRVWSSTLAGNDVRSGLQLHGIGSVYILEWSYLLLRNVVLWQRIGMDVLLQPS